MSKLRFLNNFFLKTRSNIDKLDKSITLNFSTIILYVLPVDTYPMPHIAVIYRDGSVFDISLEEKLSPSKNLLIKLPDDTNDKDDRGKRYAYQDQIGTLYFFSSTISRPVTQLQQKSRFHTITHNGQKLFDLDRRVKLYSGTQLGNKFWVWGSAYHGGEQNTGCMFICIYFSYLHVEKLSFFV